MGTHKVPLIVRTVIKEYSNLVDIYCCSAMSCDYVVFPAIRYEAYFEKCDIL